jgi:hypothetical protein
MYLYRIHTLVDITQNGPLNQKFPFKTLSGDVVHDKQTLAVARNQNSNFTTLIQLLQMRGNIIYKDSPVRKDEVIANTHFGEFYEGKQSHWTFNFFTEQQEVYATMDNKVGSLISDFDLVPVVSFCKETATNPTNTFLTIQAKLKNTYFTYSGFQNK